MVTRRWWLGLACLVATCSCAQGAPQTTLLIATNELPPYISAQPAKSFVSELFSALGQEMGVRFEFKFMPWKRCELAADSLAVWAALPYVPTPERTERFHFSEPLFEKRTKLFYYSAQATPRNIAFNSLQDLKAYRLGGVLGYYYVGLFEQAGLKVEYVADDELNFRKLRAGRVELIPATELIGWDIIRRTFPETEQNRFFTVAKPLVTGANYLMVSKRYPDGADLLARFNQALIRLKANGIYQRLAKSHGIDPAGRAEP